MNRSPYSTMALISLREAAYLTSPIVMITAWGLASVFIGPWVGLIAALAITLGAFFGGRRLLARLSLPEIPSDDRWLAERAGYVCGLVGYAIFLLPYVVR